MKSVWITDLRTREMQNAHDYLSAQGWQVLTSPEGLCLWDEAAVHAFVASCGEIRLLHPFSVRWRRRMKHGLRRHGMKAPWRPGAWQKPPEVFSGKKAQEP